MKHYLVIDIGGSSMKCAIMDEERTVLERWQVRTPCESLDELLETIDAMVADHRDRVVGIAISMPGIIDAAHGVAHTGGALRFVKDLPFADMLEERYGLPVSIENDARCAAYAEVGYGALADVSDGAVIVLGTGVGGGIVLDRTVRTGAHCCSGEFSYIRLDVNDSRSWTHSWDELCGTAGLLRRAQEELGTQDFLTGKEIFELAEERGSEPARRAVDRFAADVAFGAFNLHAAFDFERIAISGGISVHPLLIERIQSNFDQIYESLGLPFPKPEVVACQFRNDANLVGALYQHVTLKGEQHA